MTPTSPTIAVIGASVRTERIGHHLVDWAVARLRGRVPVEVVDPADCDLPDDRSLQPGGSPASAVAGTIDAADGFVLVTPEYNHSYPAALKRVIDAHYREWMFKPATVISYGVQGGLLATEHLRGVLAELHVVTTRRVVGLRTPWDRIDGGFVPEEGTDRALDAAVDELLWWAETLRSARRDRPFVR